MTKKLNLYSLIMAISCWTLFLLIGFNRTSSGIHSSSNIGNLLYIVLGLTIVSFILNILGFAGMKNGRSVIRSTVTVLLNFSLLVVLTIVLTIGHLLG